MSAPRVAVACSGLGHVQRGIEAWAFDLAKGLERAGVTVSLFGGASGDGIRTVPCLKRTGSANNAITGTFRRLGGWRYGLGSPYEVEQTSFSLALWPKIRGDFDILHVQDPLIAAWFERAFRLGLSAARVVYANGTGESMAVTRRFQNLQVLTREAFDEAAGNGPPGQTVFRVPNFVDTSLFRPGDQARARARFGLPRDRPIVLCCAAIRRFHKRIDYLLAEFERLTRESDTDAMLVVAGGRESDTNALIAEGTARLGDRVCFLPDMPRAHMPDLYRAADIFALASLHEMFGIVLIEAMASGLPVVCHDVPNFHEIVGPAGIFGDLTAAGGMAAALATMLDPAVRAGRAGLARHQAESIFSETAVIPEMIGMYRAILAKAPRAS